MAVSIKQLSMYTANMHSYAELKKALDGKACKRLSPTATIIASPSSIWIQYYDTEVLEFYSTGDIKIRSGGYQTLTTREVINAFLPNGYTMVQRAKQWILVIPTGEIPYSDDMMICL